MIEIIVEVQVLLHRGGLIVVGLQHTLLKSGEEMGGEEPHLMEGRGLPFLRKLTETLAVGLIEGQGGSSRIF